MSGNIPYMDDQQGRGSSEPIREDNRDFPRSYSGSHSREGRYGYDQDKHVRRMASRFNKEFKKRRHYDKKHEEYTSDPPHDCIRVEMCEFYPWENAQEHNTHMYEIVYNEPYRPVYRRGLTFRMTVWFKDRPFDPEYDNVRLVFNFGPNPSVAKETKIYLPLTTSEYRYDDDRVHNWEARIQRMDDTCMDIEVYIPPETPVGVWRCWVETCPQGFSYYRRDGSPYHPTSHRWSRRDGSPWRSGPSAFRGEEGSYDRWDWAPFYRDDGSYWRDGSKSWRDNSWEPGYYNRSDRYDDWGHRDGSWDRWYQRDRWGRRDGSHNGRDRWDWAPFYRDSSPQWDGNNSEYYRGNRSWYRDDSRDNWDRYDGDWNSYGNSWDWAPFYGNNWWDRWNQRDRWGNRDGYRNRWNRRGDSWNRWNRRGDSWNRWNRRGDSWNRRGDSWNRRGDSWNRRGDSWNRWNRRGDSWNRWNGRGNSWDRWSRRDGSWDRWDRRGSSWNRWGGRDGSWDRYSRQDGWDWAPFNGDNMWDRWNRRDWNRDRYGNNWNCSGDRYNNWNRRYSRDGSWDRYGDWNRRDGSWDWAPFYRDGSWGRRSGSWDGWGCRDGSWNRWNRRGSSWGRRGNNWYNRDGSFDRWNRRGSNWDRWGGRDGSWGYRNDWDRWSRRDGSYDRWDWAPFYRDNSWDQGNRRGSSWDRWGSRDGSGNRWNRRDGSWNRGWRSDSWDRWGRRDGSWDRWGHRNGSWDRWDRRDGSGNRWSRRDGSYDRWDWAPFYRDNSWDQWNRRGSSWDRWGSRDGSGNRWNRRGGSWNRGWRNNSWDRWGHRDGSWDRWGRRDSSWNRWGYRDGSWDRRDGSRNRWGYRDGSWDRRDGSRNRWGYRNGSWDRCGRRDGSWDMWGSRNGSWDRWNRSNGSWDRWSRDGGWSRWGRRDGSWDRWGRRGSSWDRRDGSFNRWGGRNYSPYRRDSSPYRWDWAPYNNYDWDNDSYYGGDSYGRDGYNYRRGDSWYNGNWRYGGDYWNRRDRYNYDRRDGDWYGDGYGYWNDGRDDEYWRYRRDGHWYDRSNYYDEYPYDYNGEVFKCKQDIYILFNPWCRDDPVYMDDEMWRQEYILNDTGKIWVGSYRNNHGRRWVYGQFDDVVLPAVMYLLEEARMSGTDRANPIRVVRAISEMVNNQDWNQQNYDRRRNNQQQGNCLMMGRWDGKYDDGVSPYSWTGSIKIMEQYLRTGKPVKYGQCWVYAGLATTICRALGIPCRPITNFTSAHDTNNTMSIDKYFSVNGDEIERGPDGDSWDSVWSFHCWNDVWMDRPDLPPGCGGWQAIDSTFQEESDGRYRCGPASLECIRSGEIGFNYDTKYLFTELNAEVNHWQQDEHADHGFNRLRPGRYCVGREILTKRPDHDDDEYDDDCMDIIYEYKPRDWHHDHDRVMNAFRGMEHGYRTKKYDRYFMDHEDVLFDMEEMPRVYMGQPFMVVMHMMNRSNETRSIEAMLSCHSMYYNGVKNRRIMQDKEFFVLPPNQEQTFVMQIMPEDYEDKMVDFCMMKMYALANVKETRQAWGEEEDFYFEKPRIHIQTSGPQQVDQDMEVNFCFTNPMNVTLTNCRFSFEGPGLQRPRTVKYRDIRPGEMVCHIERFVPKQPGETKIVTTFTSHQLNDVCGSRSIGIRE